MCQAPGRVAAQASLSQPRAICHPGSWSRRGTGAAKRYTPVPAAARWRYGVASPVRTAREPPNTLKSLVYFLLFAAMLIGLCGGKALLQ
jgi:hypothetical protein